MAGTQAKRMRGSTAVRSRPRDISQVDKTGKVIFGGSLFFDFAENGGVLMAGSLQLLKL